jgi:acyl-CoA thioesterase-1
MVRAYGVWRRRLKSKSFLFLFSKKEAGSFLKKRSKKLLLLCCAFVPTYAAAAPVRLLIFGDSLVAGYGLPHDDAFQARLGAALKADGRNVVLLDGGVSGDTTAGGRARLDWALADQPDAVLLELGANDALRGTDPRETETNLAAMLDRLAAAHLPVLLTGMEAPPNLGAAYGAQFRAVFAKLGARPGIIFDPFFLQGVAGNPALNQDDHMHPNAAGVAIEVARIKPLVEKLLDETK